MTKQEIWVSSARYHQVSYATTLTKNKKGIARITKLDTFVLVTVRRIK
jgi:hypothetical protein